MTQHLLTFFFIESKIISYRWVRKDEDSCLCPFVLSIDLLREEDFIGLEIEISRVFFFFFFQVTWRLCEGLDRCNRRMKGIKYWSSWSLETMWLRREKKKRDE